MARPTVRTVFLFLVTGFGISLLHQPCTGQTTWTGAAGPDWAVAGNWSGGVPSASVDAVIPAGTPNQPSTAGGAATCRDLTVAAGATVTLAPGFPLEVARAATVSGSLAGGGLLRFVGSTGATVTATGTIGAAVEIAKSGGAILTVGSSWTVNGDLLQSSGTFSVASSPAVTVSVSGNASFSGGTLMPGVSTGTIDVAGSVTFAGTSVSGTTPTIRCAGSAWTSNPPFAPGSGSVVLDRAGAQAILGAGTFPGLTIAATSAAARSGNLTVAGALAINGTLTHSAGTVAVNGAISVTGTLSMPTSTLDANGGFTLAASGSADLGGGTHTFGANFTGSGALTATGTFVFDSSSGGSVLGTAAFPSVQISKSSGAAILVNSSWTVNGNLALSSGTFNVAQAPAYIVSVSGNATFTGGTLAAPFAATIDVAGDVTFAGTSVTNLSPTIRCAGTWTSDAGYAPSAGSVVLDGTGAQTILGAGTLPGLTIAATSAATRSGSLSLSGGLTVNGSLAQSGGTVVVAGAATVAGTLSMPSSALDANGSFTIAATGSADLGGGAHTFASSFTGSGTLIATGSFTFDSSTGGIVSGTAALPSVQIAKSSNASITVNSSWSVNGNLALVSGVFNVAQAPTYVVAVSGNATFTGGTLGTPVAGTIDVAGDVTFAGTPVTNLAPTIRCGGSWTSDAAYAPANGSVVLDGTGAQAILGTGTLPSLTIVATSSVTRSGNLTLTGGLALDGSLTHSAGTVTINGSATVSGTLSMPSSTLDANGAFTIASPGTVNLGSGTHTFGAGYLGAGTVMATGLFIFDGPGSGNVSGAAPLPSVQIARSGGGTVTVAGPWTVNGDLAFVSGTFSVSAPPGYTVTVLGNATFSGGAIGIPVQGTIDVAGNVTFSGTPVSGLGPTIKCAGNWTSNAAYAPASSTTILDGATPQTLSAAGPFANLTIAAGASVATIGNLTVMLALTVNGTLAVTPGTLDVNGAFTVSATGSAELGSGTHTFAANYTVAGSMTAAGTFVFDSANTATALSSASLPSIEVAKMGAAPLIVGGDLTVNGDVTLTSGGLSVSAAPGYTLSVLGNAMFAGGALGVPVVGTIDVDGDVTFSGTTVASVIPTIRCGGNWASGASFTPGSGIVELDGTAATTFTSTTGTLQMPTLKIKNGPKSASTGLSVSATTIIIDPAGSLVVDAFQQLTIHRPAGPTALTVDGALSCGLGAQLALGPQVSATVSPSGLLSLIGGVGFPAAITGASGGGYALTVNGALAAKNFVVKEMGPGGMLINASAAFAAPPNDVRGGTFDFRPGAPAGSVLLDVRRAAPADIRYTTFLNTPGASGVFNAKTSASSAAVSFTNWTGAFSGAAFENDPVGLIAWNAPQQTSLVFSAQPGAEISEITWSGITFVDYAGFSLRRATSPGGPFVEIFGTSVVDTSYGWTDEPLVPNQAYYYQLHQQLTHDPWILIASGTTTPYSAGPPPNVYKVGAGGPYATIQAAINAAVSPISIVWVTPGTYAPFSIGPSAPASLRIAGDGSGPILIDTSAGPIQVLNVPATSGIEIGDLAVGSATTAQSAIVITNTACPVVLDELVVSSAPSHAAIAVSGSPAVAIQRCDVAGGPGVLVAASSYVSLGRGTLSSLVSTGSTIEIAELVPGSVSVTPAGSLIAHAGPMPKLDLPEYPRLSYGATLAFDGFPGVPVTLVVANRLGFLTVPPATELPVLVDLATVSILPPLPTNGAGHFETSFELPPVAALLGSTYVVQAAVVNPLTGAFRLSNVATMAALP